MASHLVVLFCWIIFIYRATHFIKIYFDNAVDYKTADPEDIGVIKVHQFFHQLFHHKKDNFDVYRRKALSFYFTHLRNTTLNVTLEQLRRLLKEQPEIESGFFTMMLKLLSSCDCFWRSNFTLKFLWQKDCIYTRTHFERFWSVSIRTLWRVLSSKLPPQAHWVNELEWGTKTKIMLLIPKVSFWAILCWKDRLFFGKLEIHNAPQDLLDCANTQ